MYTKTTAKNGRIMYFKDKKLVSIKDIPMVDRYELEGISREQAELLVAEDKGQTVDPNLSDAPQLKQGKLCIFCGHTATTSKYINGKTSLLCQDDWTNNTTGEIAAQMRKEHG